MSQERQRRQIREKGKGIEVQSRGAHSRISCPVYEMIKNSTHDLSIALTPLTNPQRYWGCLCSIIAMCDPTLMSSDGQQETCHVDKWDEDRAVACT